MKRGVRWRRLDEKVRRRLLRAAACLLAVGAAVAGAGVGLSKLEAHVEAKLLDRFPRAAVVFMDLPDRMRPLAESSLLESVTDLLEGNWLEPALCRQLAERIRDVAWVRALNAVRRTPDGRFEVSADYRVPAAMVQQQGVFTLVDQDGVRLPGRYRFDPRWPLLQGVRGPSPDVGRKWEGADVAAGLAVVEALAGEPFRTQITAVLLDNYSGRANPRASHVELATDRTGGRIRWGSAPGFEVEENTLEQKVAILRATFSQTGRVDAEYPVIDISTFPDRFIVPG